MKSTQGYSLIDYINSNSRRFAARALEFGGDSCWVIVAESKTEDGGFAVLEPIADFEGHLNRARREAALFPAEYVRLLERWKAYHNAAGHV